MTRAKRWAKKAARTHRRVVARRRRAGREFDRLFGRATEQAIEIIPASQLPEGWIEAKLVDMFPVCPSRGFVTFVSVAS